MAKRQKQQSSSSSIENLIASLGGVSGPTNSGPNSVLFDPANFAKDPSPSAVLNFADGLNLQANAPKVSKDPSLEDLNQLFGTMNPGNPMDLIPGQASLSDVKARLTALGGDTPPSPPKSLTVLPKAPIVHPFASQLAQLPVEAPAPQLGQLPAQPPTAEPLAPIPATAPETYLDDIQSIMNDRKKIRDQQMSLAENQGGDPWIRALVGLGGLGADALSKNYNNNYQNAALKAYDTPFDQARALRLKALDAQIADKNPLLELAKAREVARIKASGTGKGKSLADQKELKSSPTYKDLHPKAGGMTPYQDQKILDYHNNFFETKNQPYITSLNKAYNVEHLIKGIMNGTIKSSPNVANTLATDINVMQNNGAATVSGVDHARISSLQGFINSNKSFFDGTARDTIPVDQLKNLLSEVSAVKKSIVNGFKSRVNSMQTGQSDPRIKDIYQRKYEEYLKGHNIVNSESDQFPRTVSKIVNGKIIDADVNDQTELDAARAKGFE